MWTPCLHRPTGKSVLESREAWQLGELESGCPESLPEKARTVRILGRLRRLKPSEGPGFNNVLRALKVFGGRLVSKDDLSCPKLSVLV